MLEKITHPTLDVVEFAFIVKTLTFKLINIKHIQKCISFEIRIVGKCCKFVCLYRSLSQTNDKFEFFLKKFEVTFDKIHEENAFIITALGDLKSNTLA